VTNHFNNCEKLLADRLLITCGEVRLAKVFLLPLSVGSARESPFFRCLIFKDLQNFLERNIRKIFPQAIACQHLKIYLPIPMFWIQLSFPMATPLFSLLP
jgi:hypothetical protein